MRILCPRFVAACIMDGVWHFSHCGTVPDIYRCMDKGGRSSSSMMRFARARGESEGEAGSFRSHCSRFSQVRCRLAYCRVARASWIWQFSREISPRSMLRINARPRVRSAVAEHGPREAASSTAPSCIMRAARRAILPSSSGTSLLMTQPGPRGGASQFLFQKESGFPPARTISRLRST